MDYTIYAHIMMETAEIKKITGHVVKQVGRTIGRYGLVMSGDHVLVGLSGGKDSMTLLETLALRRIHLPRGINYRITAVHVDVAEIPYAIHRDAAEELCARLDVPFIWRETSCGWTENSGETPCAGCARARRNMMFSLAGELGCNRVALGHHRDDILETLLMNMIFQGTFSTMPPRLSLFGGELDIIRPLADLSGDDVARYAAARGFAAEAEPCPYGNNTMRHSVKEILNGMDSLYSGARNNLMRSMSHVMQEYLNPQ